MDMTTAVRSVLSRYAEFSGRSRRAEYWYFALAYILFEIAYLIVSGIVHVIGFAPLSILLGLASFIIALGLLVPSLAVAFRRLHDTDRSAWWLLIALAPFIGGIVLLVFYCLPGTPGPNRYGPDPLAPTSGVADQFS
jgi:uncharacterized membrane protein YhaH (DUF805 family)